MNSWTNSRNLGDSNHLDTVVWKDISHGLSFFRQLTKVMIGNGRATSFWLDLWILGDTPASRFSMLFSHYKRLNASVTRVLSSSSLVLGLQPKISFTAENGLTLLRSMATIILNSRVEDTRIGRLDGKPLSTRLAYAAAFANRPIDSWAMAVWKNYAPNKCIIFLWLAFKNRLFTKERRFRRGIAHSGCCPFLSISGNNGTYVSTM